MPAKPRTDCALSRAGWWSCAERSSLPTAECFCSRAGTWYFHGRASRPEPCLTSATALTRARLVMLDGRALQTAAAQHPEVGAALARVMGGQWRMAVRHIIDLKCRSAPERLIAFLLGSSITATTTSSNCLFQNLRSQPGWASAGKLFLAAFRSWRTTDRSAQFADYRSRP